MKKVSIQEAERILGEGYSCLYTCKRAKPFISRPDDGKTCIDLEAFIEFENRRKYDRAIQKPFIEYLLKEHQKTKAGIGRVVGVSRQYIHQARMGDDVWAKIKEKYSKEFGEFEKIYKKEMKK